MRDESYKHETAELWPLFNATLLYDVANNFTFQKPTLVKQPRMPRAVKSYEPRENEVNSNVHAHTKGGSLKT